MKFEYQKVIDLGFEREDDTDSMFAETYGWHPFYTTLKLTKRIYLNWDCETREIQMIRYDKESSILGRMKIESEEMLMSILKFFGKIKTEEKPNIDYSVINAC